jgi:hypothetical protein
MGTTQAIRRTADRPARTHAPAATVWERILRDSCFRNLMTDFISLMRNDGANTAFRKPDWVPAVLQKEAAAAAHLQTPAGCGG